MATTNPFEMLCESGPANIDAEKALLGAILLDNEVFAQVGRLQESDFAVDWHRTIFRAYREMLAHGTAVDPVTFAEHTEGQRFGGMVYLMSLTDGVPRRLAIQKYVQIVKDRALSRRLIGIGESLALRARENLSISENLSTIESQLLEIESDRQGTNTYHISEFMAQAIMNLKTEAENKGLIGFTTGISGLDELTTGVRKGELWLIGGLPNSGKTPLGTQIALANAENGVPTMVFSLEMSRFQLANRIIAQFGIVSSRKIRRPGFITDAEWVQLFSQEQEISRLPVWVNDASQIELTELLMRAKLAIRSHAVQLIVVDYLMLVDAPGKQLREQADAIANGLKAVAKTENVAVVLLSQFKRPSDLNDRPNLTWFKESGGIEAVANTALAMYCPVGDDGITPTGEYEIMIVKQREGERGAVPVALNTSEIRFYDREK